MAVLVTKDLNHDIRPALAYLKTNWHGEEPIKIFAKAANELNYYSAVYPEMTDSYKGFVQLFDNMDSLLPLLQPTWFLFTAIDPLQHQQFLDKLSEQGKIITHISEKRSYLYQVIPK